MQLREQCSLIEVQYNQENTKVTLTFLDEEAGEILEVMFNKQSYDKDAQKFIEDASKEAKVEEWCKEYFDTTFDKLNSVIGVKKDVYHYDSFNSLWESEFPVKFTKDQEGEVLNCTITDVNDNGNIIQILYTDNDTGTLFKSNMSYSKYLEERKEWFVDPVKKERTMKKFKDKFGVDVEDAKELVGKEIMVEVRKAFGTNLYGDIKKPKWSK